MSMPDPTSNPEQPTAQHLEEMIKRTLSEPVRTQADVLGCMALRSLLSSCVIELQSLRELCKQQRKRIDELMNDMDEHIID